jgi:hypothetical protein
LFLPNVLTKLFAERVQFFVARATFLNLAAERGKKVIDARSAERIAKQSGCIRPNVFAAGAGPLTENGFGFRRNRYL